VDWLSTSDYVGWILALDIDTEIFVPLEWVYRIRIAIKIIGQAANAAWSKIGRSMIHGGHCFLDDYCREVDHLK
jgi:hypothetical protein